MLSRMGGFLGSIGHSERKRTFVSMTNGVERGKRNPPLQKSIYLPIEPVRMTVLKN
jgi:hypothetical protein